MNEVQAGIKIAGRNINNLRYADDTAVMADNKEKLKSILMKVKEKIDELKVNIQMTQFIVSITIISWQIYGETMETATEYILFSWAPKSLQMVTAAMKLKGFGSLEENL